MIMNNKFTKKHHYAIEAATVLHNCREKMVEILDTTRRNVNVLELDRTLLTTEQMLHYHLLNLLDIEMQDEKASRDRIDIRRDGFEIKLESRDYQDVSNITSITNRTIMETVEALKSKSVNSCYGMTNMNSRPMFSKKPHQRKRSSSFPGYNNLIHPSSSCFIPTKERNEQSYLEVPITKSATEKSVIDSLLFRLIVILQLCLVRIDEAHSILHARSSIESWTLFGASTAFAATSAMVPSNKNRFYKVASGLACTGGIMMLRKGWRLICMNARLLNSSLTLEDWQQQWTLIQSINLGEDDSEDQCKRLLELIPVHKVCFKCFVHVFQFLIDAWIFTNTFLMSCRKAIMEFSGNS